METCTERVGRCIKQCLLIAPIWNGNRTDQVSHQGHCNSFNRTNLEWKPCFLTSVFASCESTFNRTNLEWKLASRDVVGGWFLSLLIAPIWNGNNATQKVSQQLEYHLLIAPIWNGNDSPNLLTAFCFCSFNRTNLEWKRFPKLTHCVLLLLLIAPIWNGNVSYGEVSPSGNGTFNRTNLEWKQKRTKSDENRTKSLLIAPIWNGNSRTRPQYIFLAEYF